MVIFYKLIINLLIPSGKLKMLDLGCGKGTAGDYFNKDKKHELTGVDIFEQYIKECKSKACYSKVINKDIRKIDFPKKSFDVVLLLQVVEHLKKAEALKLIKKAEKIARKVVVVSTPNGGCEQDVYDSNLYQKHLSIWSLKDFYKLGYRVCGQGLRFVYSGESHVQGERMKIWQYILLPISLLLFPLTLFVPNFSAQLIAFKYLDD